MPVNKYPCAQQELYIICRAGWQSCTDQLASFTAFSPMYEAALITAALAAVDAAEVLPDEEQRAEDAQTTRVQLVNQATTCCNNWQRLKRYVEKAYPEDEVEIKLNAAGWPHYEKAANKDWAACSRLLTDGETFITDNTATLSANDNMPPTFGATFTTAKEEYNTLHQLFITLTQNKEIHTQTKITANNDIYATLITMFKDGQEIFKTNEAVKKLFTFDQVWLTVSGPGVASIKGTVKDSATNQPITVTATISIFSTEHSAQTDEESRYQLTPITAGTYTIIAEAPGYQTLQIPNTEIEIGVIKTLNIALDPVS